MKRKNGCEDVKARKLNIYTVLNTLHYIRYDLCSLQERAEVSAESGCIVMVVSVLRLYSASFSNIFYIKSWSIEVIELSVISKFTQSNAGFTYQQLSIMGT